MLLRHIYVDKDQKVGLRNENKNSYVFGIVYTKEILY